MAIQAQVYCENLGFCFGGQQDFLVDNGKHQNHPTMQYQHILNRAEWNQDFSFNDRFLRPEVGSMVFPQSMQSQIEKESKEVDLLISLQNERLRLALQEQRKQQITLLLKSYESKAQFLFQQKDEEIGKAISRTIELEELLKRIETDNLTWQRVAKENEAVIMSLNNTMDQIRKEAVAAAAPQSGGGNNAVEDAESCCEFAMNSAIVAAEQTREGRMLCKICRFRSSSVVLLPCRHLCSCNVCEAFIESCPLCNMVKKASIEALL